MKITEGNWERIEEGVYVKRGGLASKRSKAEVETIRAFRELWFRSAYAELFSGVCQFVHEKIGPGFSKN